MTESPSSTANKKEKEMGSQRRALGTPAVLAVVVALAIASSLMGSAAASTAGVVSGGNGRIAFVSTRDGNSEIYSMLPDGSGLERLTFDAAEDVEPSWSPDGSRLVFSGGLSNDARSGELFVMNQDGSGRIQLTNNLVPDMAPAWSPDGSRIAFQRQDAPGGNWDIYTMSVDGTNIVRLTFAGISGGGAAEPAWSPDGETIAFTAQAGFPGAGPFGGIFVMNADGSAPRALAIDTAYCNYQPAWSPDGQRIAFTRLPCPSGGPVAIWIMNADGGSQVALVPFGNNSNSAWSPDGSKIAFERFTNEGYNEIFVVNTDGSALTNLSNDPAFDIGPDWAAVPLQHVGIDVKPGGERNSISLSDQGRLSVGVLGSAVLDVSQIDPSTVAIGGVSLALRGSPKAPRLAYAFDDINGDGRQDLVAIFDIQNLVAVGALSSSTTALSLTGLLFSGTGFEGSDVVTIVP